MALGSHAISPAGFTAVRLGAGAAALWLLVALRTGAVPQHAGQWASAAALFAYAAAFSFAYVSLGAGTGALILFGAVQLTMILAGLRAGERPVAAEWVGLGLAVSGLVVLVFPGLTAPAPAGCRADGGGRRRVGRVLPARPRQQRRRSGTPPATSC